MVLRETVSEPFELVLDCLSTSVRFELKRSRIKGMNRADIEEFFKTPLLGDFEEHQNPAAQIVDGRIAPIPISDR